VGGYARYRPRVCFRASETLPQSNLFVSGLRIRLRGPRGTGVRTVHIVGQRAVSDVGGEGRAFTGIVKHSVQNILLEEECVWVKVWPQPDEDHLVHIHI